MLRKCLLIAALIPALAHADATLKYKSKSQNNQLTTTMYVSGPNLRMDTTGTQQPVVMIYNRGTDEVVLLDESKKQYMKMDEVAKQAESISNMVQQAMKNVPPEQQAMMKRMMGKMGGIATQPKAEPTQASFKKTGKTDNVSGISCEWAKRDSANGKESKFCLADYDKLGMSSDDYSTLKQFMKKSSKMAKQANRMSGGMIRSEQMFNGEIEGMPVKMVDASSGQVMELSSRDSGANPPGGFGIPAGYSAMLIPDMLR